MKINKIAITAVASIGVLIAGGFLLASQYTAEAKAKLSVEDAKNIAFNMAKVNGKDVKQYAVKLEKENGKIVYDVEFFVNNISYDYEIDANTGEIISSDSEVEHLIIKTENVSQTQKNNTQKTNTQNTNKNKANNTQSNSNYISVAKAKSIAMADAGVTSSKANFYTSKLDYDDGRAVYDIEFYVGNVEYDYEIDALTGQILEKDTDIENFSIPQKTNTQNTQNTNKNKANNTQSNSNYISAAKAKSIALNHAGVSSSNAKFTKVEFDTDDGIKIYEIEFKANGLEYDYEINAVTGVVRDFSIDD